MPALNYVGAHATGAADVINRRDLIDILNNLTPNRTAVGGQVADAAANYASKIYVDNQDNGYVGPDYYQDQDALNIPIESRGVPNGVASLDSGGKIPLAQVPGLGAGYLIGPYGPHHLNATPSVFTGTTGNTPLRIADFELGTQTMTSFRPLVFMVVLVSSTYAAVPTIEVRISDGTAPYADQTLVAMGSGRSYFNSSQSVTVRPAADATGRSGLTTPPSYTHPYLTAWAYDPMDHSITVDGTASAVCFLLRTAE